jgi:hypothetical protein
LRWLRHHDLWLLCFGVPLIAAVLQFAGVFNG